MLLLHARAKARGVAKITRSVILTSPYEFYRGALDARDKGMVMSVMPGDIPKLASHTDLPIQGHWPAFAISVHAKCKFLRYGRETREQNAHRDRDFYSRGGQVVRLRWPPGRRCDALPFRGIPAQRLRVRFLSPPRPA